jgi:hypothetical protein
MVTNTSNGSLTHRRDNGPAAHFSQAWEITMEQSRTARTPAERERAAFHERFARSFDDPRFDGLRDAVNALEEVAWRQYCAQRRPPPH